MDTHTIHVQIKLLDESSKQVGLWSKATETNSLHIFEKNVVFDKIWIKHWEYKS